MSFTDDDVAHFATYITGHPEATPERVHLAATRAVLGGLAKEGRLLPPPADAADQEMRYPEGRPGWLGEFQSWPCGRCGNEVDDSEKHRCVPHPCGDYPAPCNHDDEAHMIRRSAADPT